MTVLTDAFVLRKSQRGDYDRQYIFFTKELGKITALAKGAMKISSKLAPHLDYFYLTEVMVAPGKGYYRLAGAKLKRAYLTDSQDELKLNSACFFLETASNLIVDSSPDEQLYEIIAEFFSALAKAQAGRETHLVLNRALFELLSKLGYQPELKAKSQAQLTNDLHRLILEVGEKEVKSFPLLNRELSLVM